MTIIAILYPKIMVEVVQQIYQVCKEIIKEFLTFFINITSKLNVSRY